jgi:hypothetical protein
MKKEELDWQFEDSQNVSVVIDVHASKIKIKLTSWDGKKYVLEFINVTKHALKQTQDTPQLDEIHEIYELPSKSLRKFVVVFAGEEELTIECGKFFYEAIQNEQN